MNYLLIILTMMSVGAQYVITGLYSRNAKFKSPYMFMFLISVVVMLFYCFYSGFQLSFAPELIRFSLLFGISYCLVFLFQIMAIERGGVTLTSLLLSYSLILPTMFGIIVYKDKVTVAFLIGLLLVLLSLFLINYKERIETSSKMQKGWLLLSLIAFAGNGICSIVQTASQKEFNGHYKAEFMILAMAIVAVVNGAIILLRREYHSVSFRKDMKYGLLCGIFNALANLLIMILSVSTLPISLIFTLISAGSVITTYIASRFIFKEQLNKVQNIGLAVGIISIVFLTL